MVDQWLWLVIKSHSSPLQIWQPSLSLGKDLKVELINTTWKGCKIPLTIDETTMIICNLFSFPCTKTCLDIFFPHVLEFLVGIKCIPLWSVLLPQMKERYHGAWMKSYYAIFLLWSSQSWGKFLVAIVEALSWWNPLSSQWIPWNSFCM
jgi:hypothetical protein